MYVSANEFTMFFMWALIVLVFAADDWNDHFIVYVCFVLHGESVCSFQVDMEKTL